ncbi:flagellar biosynthesis protein FlhF [Parahaliea mediterranea]|uniref:Flagellar biosynthesis protein FlhF n=1 Tax=Parahaliea mediterranea TaxID=651086 RepID=A0A939DDZ7_9GAMM|nr:flagellar biosynthesis protein FlhF [Parahaliea mediterranea]MBN7795802.1 flagellar biosynthesis protein FlhF [Parahaliea mediterranea]
MTVRRFVGTSSREAMRQVRASLGEDALILANRHTEAGIEILAMTEHDSGAVTAAAVDAPRFDTVAADTAPADVAAADAAAAVAAAAVAAAADAVEANVAAADAAADFAAAPAAAKAAAEGARGAPPAGLAHPVAAATAAVAEPTPAVSSATGDDLLAAHERLLREVQEMRELLDASRMAPRSRDEEGRTGTADDSAGADAGRAEAGRADAGRADAGRVEAVRRNILAAGLGVGLAEEILAAMPTGLETGRAMDAWLARQLIGRLRVAEDAGAELDEGGVLALIGPTGVGKTTTAAKLAARYAMRHGSEGIALVSADHYRVGARDHLRVYAELLGVEMHALEPGDNLADLPRHLAEKPLLIVDTAGMGQRDNRLVEQMTQLAGSDRAVRGLLMVNAAAHAENLDDTIAAYRGAARAGGSEIRDAIITKLDEAPRLGPALAAVMRHGLRVNFVAHGQRVPEDLAPAVAQDLITEALMAPPLEHVEDGARGGRDPLDRSLTLHSAWDALNGRLAGLGGLERAWAGDVPDPLDAVPAASATLAWSKDGAPLPLALDDAGQALVPPSAGCAVRELADLPGEPSLLLASVPDSHSWLSLLERGIDWVATASHNTRVRHGGEAVPLSGLRALAQSAGATTVTYRGRQVQLRLQRAPAFLTAGGRRRRCSGYLHAWIGELRHLDTGSVLGRRYWLAPAELADASCIALFARQLTAEAFFTLRRTAMDTLVERLPGWRGQTPQLRYAAHGIAALAIRLERDNSDWALDIRAQLLALGGRSRRRSAASLLAAVMQLFSQREALRRLALAAPAGNA